jgi:hypothetical protein
MILTSRYAARLVAEGKATLDGLTYHDGATYEIVTRHDLMRVDHVLIGYGDLRRT